MPAAGELTERDQEVIRQVSAGFDIVGGLRIYDLDWDIRKTGSGLGPSDAAESGAFLHPEVGVKLNMDFGRDVTIDLQLAGGGAPTGSKQSYSVDVIAGFQWRPTAHFGLQAGYRALFFGAKTGAGENEFNFNGAMQGLYGGLVFRF